VTVQTVLGLGLAILLSRRIPGVGIMRTIILLPLAVPIAATTTLWGLLLIPAGPINGVLGLLGVSEQPLLTSQDQALFCVVLIMTWVTAGYWMTVLIAGMHDIPRELYEAAAIDGGGKVKIFFNVTLPLLRRPLVFVIVASTVSSFLTFAPVAVL